MDTQGGIDGFRRDESLKRFQAQQALRLREFGVRRERHQVDGMRGFTGADVGVDQAAEEDLGEGCDAVASGRVALTEFGERCGSAGDIEVVAGADRGVRDERISVVEEPRHAWAQLATQCEASDEAQGGGIRGS